MIGLTDDFIAIDTNVFGHINSSRNEDMHIHRLLSCDSESVKLLVDDGEVIASEYKRHLKDSMRGDCEIAGGPQMLELCIRRWMRPQKQEQVVVCKDDELMAAIKSIVPTEESTDQIFVYVAFAKDRILISNDEKHIINNRCALKLKAEDMELSQADVMTSEEASARLKKH